MKSRKVQTISKGTDYVAAKHDTLIVLSGSNGVEQSPPRDAYNVLTVRSAVYMFNLEKEPIGEETAYPAGVSRASKNLVTDEPEASRRVLTHLIAPPAFPLPGWSNTGTADNDVKETGDSFAAPGATGTVALLQEYARKANSGLGADAKQEEVMKAVLINSADKIRDLLPDSAGKGMSRTLRMQDLKSTWFDSPAADTPKDNQYNTTDPANQARQALPLDVDMGAGFLNASRALEQLKGKQFAPGTDAARIGWDYNSVTRAANAADPTEKRYKLPALKGGGYISATLTWNREVSLADNDGNLKYTSGETLTAQALANLDLYIVPRGQAIGNAIWASNSAQYNVEHFFLQLPKDNKEYDLVVLQRSATTSKYALAWWADQAPPSPPPPAFGDIEGRAWVDINGNGTYESGLGDTALPHVWTQLINSSNQVIDRVMTDAAGGYQFEDVAPGNYTIKFETPDRAAVTLQNVSNPPAGANDTNDSDIDSLGVVSVTVASVDVTNVDAGYKFNNAAPIGVADTYTAPHSGVLTVSAANGVLSNDSDPEGTPLTAVLLSAPDVGTVTFAPNGSFVYTFDPTIDFSGPVTFAYAPVDNAGRGSPVWVTIAISNGIPTATNDTASTNEDTPITLSVLSNDSDPNADPLTISRVTQGTHGTVRFTDTSVKYTPDPNWFGTDTFTYTIDDKFGGTATATVTITVNSVNDPPVAKTDTATTNQNTAVSIPVTANDTDVDGDSPLTVTGVTQGAHGSVTFTASGVIYTPALNYVGTDSFTYTISDGHGGTATGVVNITVNGSGGSGGRIGDRVWNDKIRTGFKIPER